MSGSIAPPGFDLPVGCLMRTPNGECPEYHSSADNLFAVTPRQPRTFAGCVAAIVTVIEVDAFYRSRNPKGEPQLGRRGLYATMGGQREANYDQMALLWVLNLADGYHSWPNGLGSPSRECRRPQMRSSPRSS
jgi:aminopeptidase-like protein